MNSWERDDAVLKTVQWWAGLLLLAAVALAFDAADRRIPFGVWTTGPVDEVAHLCTAALDCSSWRDSSPRRFFAIIVVPLNSRFDNPVIPLRPI